MTKRLVFLTIFIAFCGGISAFGQAPTPTPSDASTVTISRAAAIKCLEDSDTVKAQAKELTAKDQAINDLKAIISDLKVELAKTTGENTALKSAAVRTDAIIDALLRNYKARNKFGLLVF